MKWLWNFFFQIFGLFFLGTGVFAMINNSYKACSKISIFCLEHTFYGLIGILVFCFLILILLGLIIKIKLRIIDKISLEVLFEDEFKSLFIFEEREYFIYIGLFGYKKVHLNEIEKILISFVSYDDYDYIKIYIEIFTNQNKKSIYSGYDVDRLNNFFLQKLNRYIDYNQKKFDYTSSNTEQVLLLYSKNNFHNTSELYGSKSQIIF